MGQEITTKIPTWGGFFSEMEAFDNDLSDLSIEDYTKMVGEITDLKVEQAEYFLDIAKSRAAFYAEQAKKNHAIKKMIEKSATSFKEFLVWQCEQHGITQLAGDNRTLKLSERTYPSWVERELSSEDYLTLNSLMPGIVKREFSIDKEMFKKLCETNEDIKKTYSEQKTTKSVRFSNRKKGV